MRISRTAGFVVSSVVCGALVFGSAGGAIAAPVPASPVPGGYAAEDPLPDAGKFTSQVKLLKGIDGVLTPVTDLLDAILAAAGKLSPAEIAKHTKAIDSALKELPKGSGTALEVPAGPAPALPPASTPRSDPGQDLKTKAVADLRTKVGALLKASEAGDAPKVTEALDAAVTSTLNVVVSIVVGGGLPAPDLAGLPELPKVPDAGEAPKVPGSSV